MRFMMIVKATAESEAGSPPNRELIDAMGAFNGEMAKAGVLLTGEGLHSTSKGARVMFSKGKKTVIDGPFLESKELIAGFWMIQVKSKEEAMAWAMRCPPPHGDVDTNLEIRQVFEAADFPDDVLTPENKAREEALRKELAEKSR
jgi:hypothetical protein